MVEALETTPQHRHAPTVPSQREPAIPTLGELISEALALVRRDALPFSGHIVIERRGEAAHRHSVWLLGPFALVEGGWFGQVHGSAANIAKPPRWLRKHERRCGDTHWTQFSWIDETAIGEGCGTTGVGLGLGPEGPLYCALTAGRSTNHEHVPLARILRDGLRALAGR